MTTTGPIIDDGDVRLFLGDAGAVLETLPAGTVQAVVTSPPYWGLRDYGTAGWVGGDDPNCSHVARRTTTRDGLAEYSRTKGRGGGHTTNTIQHAGKCPTCGAVRTDGQLGMEPTPAEYVANLVAVFDQVRRVLRDDGTVWLNLGDSYSGGGRGGNVGGSLDGPSPNGGAAYPRPATGLKDKDLVGVPWRVAFALQAAGWYLRSDIVWSKPNPMPESVTDRPTKAHEYVFLLTKRARYFYDADAIREDIVDPSRAGKPERVNYADSRNKRSVWTIATQKMPEAHFATFPEALVRPCILAGSRPGDTVLDPFVGSGTTALVARKHARRAIGIDLSADYLAIAARRLSQLSLLAAP